MAFSDDSRSRQVLLRDLLPGMRLTPLQSEPSKVSEAEIDHEIARTLVENRQIQARAALPDIAPQDDLIGLGGRNARREAARGGVGATRLCEVEEQRSSSMPDRPRPVEIEDLTGRSASTLRKKWPLRVAAIITLITAATLYPWAIPLILVVAVVITIGLGVAMGTDGVANALERVFHWQNARHPDRAERFRARIDRMATKMDAALDRLPERWTTGLYMPDFSREALLEGAEEDRPDPFDRIATEARQI